MNREQRLLVGKQLHEGTLSAPDCMTKFGIGYTCVCSWRREYEESAGLRRPMLGKPADVPSKPLGVPAASADAPEYGAMGKEELIRELMRRDIEVARLKKATR
jgi:transposase-like protein